MNATNRPIMQHDLWELVWRRYRLPKKSRSNIEDTSMFSLWTKGGNIRSFSQPWLNTTAACFHVSFDSKGRFMQRQQQTCSRGASTPKHTPFSSMYFLSSNSNMLCLSSSSSCRDLRGKTSKHQLSHVNITSCYSCRSLWGLMTDGVMKIGCCRGENKQ